MERNLILNINKLINYIENSQKNPKWTNGELTMFCKNCSKIQNNGNITINIDENEGIISINGEKNVCEDFEYLPTLYEMDNMTSLYHQAKSAMKEAKSYGIYDKIFTEIK